MNRTTSFVALLLSAVAVAAVVWFELRVPPAPPAPARAAVDFAPVLDRLASIERRLEALERAPTLSSSAGVVPAAAPLEAKPPLPPAGSPEREREVDDLLARLKEERLTTADMDRLWELLPGSGKEDAAIAALAAYAKEHPGEADAWYGLGAALTSKLIGGKVSFMDQGALSSRAEQAFTKALEVDEAHFEARYSRAVSYTFWPETFGRGPDAIRDFEVLRERHRGDAGNPAMEDVYVKLGVQYRKAGDAKKAEEAIREGLATFPDSAELKKQLESLAGK